MKKAFLILVLSLFVTAISAQQKAAYILYTSKGKKVSYKKMIRVLSEKDIVLFGEFHNNPISHWLELSVAKDCGELRNLILGAEMFEQDNQQALDLYLQGKIDDNEFDSSTRLWKNYKTDYAPLVKYAREKKLSFAASNVPRRFAAMVAKAGFDVLDTIPSAQKAWIAPLPIAYDAELPGYKKMKEMLPGHGGDNLPKAQAIKDATMAYFILQYYKPGSLFIHYNGAYHSENYEGIVWYLKKQQPNLKYATITTVSQKDISALSAENKYKADFIICVDQEMTTTY